MIMIVVGSFSHTAILYLTTVPVCVDPWKTPDFRPFPPHLFGVPLSLALCSAFFWRTVPLPVYEGSAGKEGGSTDHFVNHK